MSIYSNEFVGERQTVSFEDMQRGLGCLSLADREALDAKAVEVFLDADSVADQYGVYSFESAQADKMVLLYSMLEQTPAQRSRLIPTQSRIN